MSIYVGNKEIKNLFAGEPAEDYSAMRGPAPEGFHVPLNAERLGVETIMKGLSLNTGDGRRINLHIPYAGARVYDNSGAEDHSNFAALWSSSTVGGSARWVFLSSSEVGTNSMNYRSYGYSIRCFKDSFETPTSSWTVIKGTLGSAGIFWNKSKGLISITSNGTTGYTIQDKNLGATTVYSNGNTLSSANCGYYYQRGNNHGFAWTGSIPTSSTLVNTSGYGPGNYYSSNKFITLSSGGDRSSVRNDNLRGGVTGIIKRQKAAKAVYLGSTKVWGSQPSLLTYEEIVAMAVAEGNPRTNTIAELNSKAEEYYDSLTNAGKIVRSDSYGRELGDNSSRKWVNLVNGQLNNLSGDKGYAAVYDATQQQWRTQYVDGGPD